MADFLGKRHQPYKGALIFEDDLIKAYEHLNSTLVYPSKILFGQLCSLKTSMIVLIAEEDLIGCF